mgnify:CR=1 FL=1
MLKERIGMENTSKMKTKRKKGRKMGWIIVLIIIAIVGIIGITK